MVYGCFKWWPLVFLPLMPSALGAQGSVELHRLTASHGMVSFSTSVALWEDVLFVGDPGHADLGSYSGSVFLFDPVTGLELGELHASDGAPGAGFGGAMAADGGLLIVGAAGDGGDASGAAYVIDVSSGQELYKLRASDAGANQYFGIDVAISGERAVVGSFWYIVDGRAFGAAYLFDLSSGQEIAKLTAHDQGYYDLFGCSVAIDGDHVLVSSRQDGDNGVNSGSVYVFDARDGTELAKLLPLDGAPFSFFGSAVALDGDRAVIGSVGSESAYLFDVGTGTQVVKVVAPDGVSSDKFGQSVGIDGGLVIVGAPWAHVNQGYFESGAAYVFDGSTGQFLDKLTAGVECGLGHPNMGYSLDFRDSLALLNAPGCNGAAHLFDTSLASATSFCQGGQCACGNLDLAAGCRNSTGSGALLEATGSASSSVDDLVFEASSLPAQTFGLVFRGDQVVGLPFGDGLRCVGGHLTRLGPPQSTGAGGEISIGPGLVGSSNSGVATRIDPGSTWNFQVWYRDANGPCGLGFNLSNAVSVLFLP